MTPKTLDYLSRLTTLTQKPVYLVGGSVRDLLAGTPDIKDIDLVMQSGSEHVAREFAGKIDGSFFFLDEERKSTRVVKQTEVGLVQFDFSNFEGPDLAADLGRRDFTMNAMALDLRRFLATRSTEGLIDLFNGRADVAGRVIRVTKPGVLDEDPLRLLRAIRFAATLGYAIEESSREHLKTRAALITKSSPERIRDEFFQVLSERGAGGHLRLMDSLGLLSPLLPELDALSGFSPGRYHTYDVRVHSIKAADYVDAVLDDLPKIAPHHSRLMLDHLDEQLENFIPRKAALRFACLLHDIAKPETLSQDETGRIHFYYHDAIGAEKAKHACRRLRLSRDTETMVTRVIRQHMRLFNLSAPGGPSKNAMHRYCRDMKDSLPESLILAQADARATYDIMPREQFTDTKRPMAAVLEYYYEKFLKTEERPLVNGNDLIERGFTPGPRFREILDEIKERQAAGQLVDRKQALDFIDNLR
jgi:poly(A) polymerase